MPTGVDAVRVDAAALLQMIDQVADELYIARSQRRIPNWLFPQSLWIGDEKAFPVCYA
jgi:hypothetical protein